MAAEFKILSNDAVREMFRADESRLADAVDAAFGKKINALAISPKDKIDIRENIVKIIDISRKYISGIDQRLLRPANYNPQTSDEMREEILGHFGGREWLAEWGVAIDQNKTIDMYRDGVINALLSGPAPRDDIISYVGMIYQNATLYDDKINEAIKNGLERGKDLKTKYPQPFDKTETIYVRVPRAEAGLVQAQDMFGEITGAIDGVEISVDKDGDSYRLNYRIGDDKMKSERLNAFFQKAGAIMNSAKDDAPAIDFADADFMNLFMNASIASVDGIRELKKSRGVAKDPTNKNILNALANNGLLMLHICLEIRNHPEFGPDMTPEKFKELFVLTVIDLGGKYNSYYESLANAAAKNKMDNDAAVDMLVFSRDPWQIATQSTYQDWQSCMHVLGCNFHCIVDDIGCGTIVCYGRDSQDPAHNLVRYSLKPYISEQGNTVYRFPREYGKLFDGFSNSVADIFQNIAGTKKIYGMYKIRNGLYADGLQEVLAMDENSDDDWLRAYHDGYKKFNDLPERVMTYDFVKAAIKYDLDADIRKVPRRLLDDHPDLYGLMIKNVRSYSDLPDFEDMSINNRVFEKIAENAADMHDLNKFAGMLSTISPGLRQIIKKRYLELIDSKTELADLYQMPTGFGWTKPQDGYDWDIMKQAVAVSSNAIKSIINEYGDNGKLILEIYKAASPDMRNSVLWYINIDNWEDKDINVLLSYIDKSTADAMLKKIPQKYKTKELYETVLKMDPNLAYNRFPDSMHTIELFLNGLISESFNFEKMIAQTPDELKTAELFDRLVDNENGILHSILFFGYKHDGGIRCYDSTLINMAPNDAIALRVAKRLIDKGRFHGYIYEEIKSESVRADKEVLAAAMKDFYAREFAWNRNAIKKLINAIPESVRGSLPKEIKADNMRRILADGKDEIKYILKTAKEKIISKIQKTPAVSTNRKGDSLNHEK